MNAADLGKRCDDRHSNLVQRVGTLEEIIHGNGSRGLKTEVAMNTSFRKSMEGLRDTIMSKFVWLMVAQTIIIVGTLLADKLIK